MTRFESNRTICDFFSPRITHIQVKDLFLTNTQAFLGLRFAQHLNCSMARRAPA